MIHTEGDHCDNSQCECWVGFTVGEFLAFMEKRDKPFTLRRLQSEQREWSMRNFGPHPAWHPLLGAVEEIGELAHSFLKAEQGIRGTKEEHEAAAKDAVADTIIYLADFCSCVGFDLEAIVDMTWDEVKRRDWKKNPNDAAEKARE